MLSARFCKIWINKAFAFIVIFLLFSINVVAWDLSTATYDNIYYERIGTRYNNDITFKPDGTKMYVSRMISGVFYRLEQYSLSTPWDITSVSYDGDGSSSTQTASKAFKPDGTKMYLMWWMISTVDGFHGFRVYQYSLTPPSQCQNHDIGLRFFDGTSIIRLAVEPLGTLLSPLRIYKAPNTYGISLTDNPSDPFASSIKILTSAGSKFLCKLP